MPIAKADGITILLIQALAVAPGCVCVYKKVLSVNIFATTGLGVYLPSRAGFLCCGPLPCRAKHTDLFLLFNISPLQSMEISHSPLPDAASLLLPVLRWQLFKHLHWKRPRLWTDWSENSWHMINVR